MTSLGEELSPLHLGDGRRDEETVTEALKLIDTVHRLRCLDVLQVVPLCIVSECGDQLFPVPLCSGVVVCLCLEQLHLVG